MKTTEIAKQDQEINRFDLELIPKNEDQALKTLSKWPSQYYNSLTPKKINDIFESPLCSIAKFKKEEGETKCRALVVYMISDCIECFNVGKNMNQTQIARASDLIINEYYFLKPDDFKLCFNNAIIGKYGKTYDRIDIQVICDWLNQYCADRLNVAENLQYSEHCNLKESNSPLLDKDFKPIKK